jgi:NADPH:quinone reductase-like Zn-dependent oxidoreductase
VLVTGATGGVGMFAIQIAVAAGAHVTAVVSGEARMPEARELGANTVLTHPLPEDIELFDFVMEGEGGSSLNESMRSIVPGGTIAFYGTVGGPSSITLGDFQRRTSVNIRSHILDQEPGRRTGEELSILATMVSDGRIRPLIGLTLDWTRTPEAIRALTNREVRGKAVLTLE